jgi:hypothetical protein
MARVGLLAYNLPLVARNVLLLAHEYGGSADYGRR